MFATSNTITFKLLLYKSEIKAFAVSLIKDAIHLATI